MPDKEKQPGTSGWGMGVGLTTSPRKKLNCLQNPETVRMWPQNEHKPRTKLIVKINLKPTRFELLQLVHMGQCT